MSPATTCCTRARATRPHTHTRTHPERATVAVFAVRIMSDLLFAGTAAHHLSLPANSADRGRGRTSGRAAAATTVGGGGGARPGGESPSFFLAAAISQLADSADAGAGGGDLPAAAEWRGRAPCIQRRLLARLLRVLQAALPVAECGSQPVCCDGAPSIRSLRLLPPAASSLLPDNWRRGKEYCCCSCRYWTPQEPHVRVCGDERVH